jgi:DNA-binding NtrC family response regulator
MENVKKKSRILVCDDDTDIVLVISEFLAREGFTVYTAHKGEQALEKIVEAPVDLAILDIAMPEMNGIELLREIKKIKPGVHVIMITAYRDAEKVVDAFRLGAYDCIFKPFDFTYLRNSLLAKLFE